jgi:hypothetical protein
MAVIDEAVRGRLTARFGDGVGSWLDELPEAFDSLAQRWHLEYEPLIQRGTMSVVVRCRTADGAAAVLKASPDRTRLASEGRRSATGGLPTRRPCSRSTRTSAHC